MQVWFQNARAKFRRNLSKQQQQQQVLAYVTDPLNSSPPPPPPSAASCPLLQPPPWDRRDVERALGHVTEPDFRYRDVIGAPTQCRDCCSLEMASAAQRASHEHPYQQLYH